MLFDQITLLAAISLSSGALALTLLLTWLGSRSETFLVSWAAGMAFIVGGVLLFGGLGGAYSPTLQFLSFVLLVTGFGPVYAGAEQFRTGRASWILIVIVTFGWLVATAIAFLMGYSGIGTAIANLAIAAWLALTARQYWLARREAPLPLIANTVLYAATSLSFLLCGLVLLHGREFVLYGRPENWAEDINAFAVIIAVTGIGAISLALSQTRNARRHRHEARTDSLSGLLNRRFLFEKFGDAPVTPGTAVVVLDLDHFKSINDRFGHAAGDLVLRRFSTIVTDAIGDTATAARLGGEEFCIVLPATAPSEATRLAELIRSRLAAEKIELDKISIRATVSAGITMCLGEAETLDMLLSRADDALYRAKNEGRNRVECIGMRLVA